MFVELKESSPCLASAGRNPSKRKRVLPLSVPLVCPMQAGGLNYRKVLNIAKKKGCAEIKVSTQPFAVDVIK